MKVRHLDCATLCPIGGRWLTGYGSLLERERLVCHCLLVELDDGLLLVDTGLGLEDLGEPRRRLGRGFLALTQPKLDEAQTAARQLEALGFSPHDVRHVVLTHLDVDHAGGISDFPEAVVHVLAAEHDATTHPRSTLERHRYRPAQWSHSPSWSLYQPEGEPWFGFGCVRNLDGVPPEVLLVPLPGHTRGHAAVAVRTDDGWLLHAGDAYFHHSEMDPDRRRCPPLLDLFERLVQVDGEQQFENQERLRVLARENRGEVRVFSAHDAVEFERLRGVDA